MPGYKWTIHRKMDKSSNYISATGIQSSGFNRLSTLHVDRWQKNDKVVEYTAKSSGFGTNTSWLSDYTDSTLASALRGLQNHYEYMANLYDRHAGALQYARKE